MLSEAHGDRLGCIFNLNNLLSRFAVMYAYNIMKGSIAVPTRSPDNTKLLIMTLNCKHSLQ
jgi:hypothetical protein